jgi:hypothetical protein
MPTVGNAASTVSPREYLAVKKAMQGYIDGVLEGRSEWMRPNFHPEGAAVLTEG